MSKVDEILAEVAGDGDGAEYAKTLRSYLEDTTRFGNLQLARVFTSAGWSVSEASIRRWRSTNNVTN